MCPDLAAGELMREKEEKMALERKIADMQVGGGGWVACALVLRVF